MKKRELEQWQRDLERRNVWQDGQSRRALKLVLRNGVNGVNGVKDKE